MGNGYHAVIQDHWDRVHGGQGEGAAEDRLNPLAFVIHPEYLPKGKKEEGDKEKEILNWLEKRLEVLMKEAEQRAVRQINNCMFYNAADYLARNQGTKAKDFDGRSLNRNQMFIINHARDLVKQAVATLLRFEPQINVFPVNNEYSDRIGSRYSKRVIDNLFYINDMRSTAELSVLDAKNCGESFVVVEYDPSAGDIDPVYNKVMDFKAQLEASGEKYKTEYNDRGREIFKDPESGREIEIDIIKRTGEVAWRQPLSWMVLHQPAMRWRDVKYAFIGEIRHVDEIRADYPNSKGGIQSMYKKQPDTLGPLAKLGDFAIEWTFYHEGVKFLDEGYFAKFTEGTLLEHGPLPFSHRKLPIARFTDIDDPLNAHGISFFEDIRPPLVLKNRLMNLMYRNISIAGSPKLAIPEGASNPYHSSSGPFIIPYVYPMKPEVINFKTFGGEVFQFSEKILQEAQQLSGVFGLSRGEVPANARAASILNFYEEQESQRESTTIAKFGAFIEKVARLSLGTAGDFYEPEDERTLRVVGKNNRYKVKKLVDTTKLSGPYDVKLERTTALSESRQGRIEQISTLSQMPLNPQGADGEAGKPGLFTREQILHMLELADTPTFFEMATASVEKAESENEDLYEGEMVNYPEKFEAHLVHWNVHFQFMQSREFTDGVPPEIRQAFLDHMEVHEAYMYDLATKSMSFCNGLMENPYFPCVFEMGDNPSIMQLIMMHQAPPAPPPGAAAPAPEGEGAQPPPAEQAPPAEGPPSAEAAEAPVEDEPKMIRIIPDPNNPDVKLVEILDMEGNPINEKVVQLGRDDEGNRVAAVM